MNRLLFAAFALLAVFVMAAGADDIVRAGTTSRTVELILVDSTGARVASQAYTDVSCYYRREGAASASAITDSSGTLGTYTSGGWSADTVLQVYQLGVPDAAFAAGVDYVIVGCKDSSGTDFQPVSLRVNILEATPDCNVASISGDTTAADNLEADYDGTGLTRANSTIGTATTIGATGLAAINAEVDTALSDYDPPTKTEMDSGFSGLNDISAAEVNAEVVDVLETDTHSELTAPPAVGAPFGDMIQWLYQFSRNKHTSTSTEAKTYRDNGTSVVGTSTLSDDGTTFTRGEYQ